MSFLEGKGYALGSGYQLGGEGYAMGGEGYALGGEGYALGGEGYAMGGDGFMLGGARWAKGQKLTEKEKKKLVKQLQDGKARAKAKREADKIKSYAEHKKAVKANPKLLPLTPAEYKTPKKSKAIKVLTPVEYKTPKKSKKVTVKAEILDVIRGLDESQKKEYRKTLAAVTKENKSRTLESRRKIALGILGYHGENYHLARRVMHRRKQPKMGELTAKEQYKLHELLQKVGLGY